MNQEKQVKEAFQVSAGEFASRIQQSIQKSVDSGRPFSIVLIQLANMRAFRSQRPTHVVNSFLRELYTVIRKAVHPNQYVGVFQDGLGLVFDSVDVGQIDVISKKIVLLSQHVIKSGKYNDISSRWTDIIYQFLWPNKPGIIFPCAGWAMFPRDGKHPQELIKRAAHHLNEMRR